MIILCIILHHTSSLGLMGSQGSDINGLIFLSDYFEDMHSSQLRVAVSCKLWFENVKKLFPSPVRITILRQKNFIQNPLVILEEYFF